MSEQLDENDPFYASKKWGPDYRHNDEYWRWRNARDEKLRIENEAKNPQARHREPLPYFVRRGW